MREFINIVEENQLDEAPISDITHIGDWSKNSSYREQDRKLLTNPKAVTKIKSMWKYPEDIDTNIILVNNADANKVAEFGEMSFDQIKRYFPRTYEQIIPLYKSDEVNIIFTNNKGTERVPMTGWIMAHRFGHVLNRYNKGNYHHFFDEAKKTFARYFTDLSKEYNINLGRPWMKKEELLYSTTVKSLISAVCTFKAARENNLRNVYETIYELFAQYIITGKITFNDIPTRVKYGSGYFRYKNMKDYDHDNRMIKDDLAYELEQLFETTIHYAVGKIFVM